jgi:hypothetical protein
MNKPAGAVFRHGLFRLATGFSTTSGLFALCVLAIASNHVVAADDQNAPDTRAERQVAQLMNSSPDTQFQADPGATVVPIVLPATPEVHPHWESYWDRSDWNRYWSDFHRYSN